MFLNMPGLVCQHLADPSPSRDYPRGTDSATKPSQASPRHAEDRPVHAQDLEVFKELSEAPGDPKLENLMMTEEEERDFYTFTLASRNARRGRPLRRVLFSGPAGPPSE